MTFSLVIDLPRWQAHVDAYLAERPWVVPVVKGDGYGIGAQRVLEQCRRVGAPIVAAGTPEEAREALVALPGADVLVLFPTIAGRALDDDPRLVHTVAAEDTLAEIRGTGRRFVVEVDSPMGRHGIPWTRLPGLVDALRDDRCAGLAVHNPPFGDRVGFVSSLLARLGELGVTVPRLFASHLSTGEVGQLAAVAGDTRILVRTGTDLWLGDPEALRAYGEVLDVHPIAAGRRIGYSQRAVRKDTWLAVVSGGTAHGVGIETARPRMTPQLAARKAARVVLSQVGGAPSPFRLGGRRLTYLDVPHMQVSMVAVPEGAVHPGDRLPCDMRITVTRFDAVEVLGEGTTR
ncbi:alanine racemase [Arsenicicoccus dermatophilus]|uniref:alanine racemase n=1 Tax=Arsenicicoccus dermatophilus TaxID=1076331 RepID=UPI001F4D0267|nr:alanine racemase [Arsenicicoccus dermatophilus]MCH8613847.1 alanine racemase [Arsenicicoccus dermatophilus]